MAIKHGTAGADTITGTSGADQLFGEGGNDVLKGLAGGDTLDGGNGRDTVDYSGSAAGVIVHLDSGFGGNGDAQGDVYVGIENAVGSSSFDNLFGDGAANRIDGGLGNDALISGGGNDTLLGGGGNDNIFAGTGAELLNGGGGRDSLVYQDSALGVNVNLSTGQVSGGDAGGDTISGFENLFGSAGGDVLAGSLGANFLNGLDGADQLFGFAGNDVLRGATGADTMTGGDGVDSFLYGSVDESPAGFFVRDVIDDFSHAQGDKIQLAMDANPSDAVVDDFVFLGQGPTIDGPGQIEYVIEGVNTVVRINTAGDLAPEMEIQLSGRIELVAGDFIL